MHRRHGHYSDSANGPTYGPQLDAGRIQSLVDQRIKVLLGAAGSQHLNSCPQRPCLPAMLSTGMPTYGSQMPEAERILSLIDQRIKDHLGAAGSQQAVIPGYGGQPLSPPPTVPGKTTHTSNGPHNPGAMCQGNPITLVSGAVDGYNSDEDASVLQRPTQGSSTACSCLLNNERESSYLAEYVREAKNLDKGTTVLFGSWNVGSLTGTVREVVDTAARSGVNILCVQDIKWSGRYETEAEDTSFKIWYRVVEKPYGVGILIDKSLKNRIFGVTRKAGIILVKLKVSDIVLNVISAEDRRGKQSTRADQKVAVESLGVTTKWAQK